MVYLVRGLCLAVDWNKLMMMFELGSPLVLSRVPTTHLLRNKLHSRYINILKIILKLLGM